MDHFGIGNAMTGLLRTYFMAARQTGRTTSLVESVKDGDRIVFSDSRERDRVMRLLRERGVKAECVVVDPLSPERIFERGPSQGRTIFDHTWVELYYTNAIDREQRFLDRLERESSGHGGAHRETDRAALERAKW